MARSEDSMAEQKLSKGLVHITDESMVSFIY